MKRQSSILDSANTCTHCPHAILDIGRVMYCPCEDCHPGGLVQGREPKVLGLTASDVVNIAEDVRVTTYVGDLDDLIRND